jgi:hypothetical protein
MMKLTVFLPSHSCTDAPVFLAKPSVGFFTDYEIGPVYEVDPLFLYMVECLNHTGKPGKPNAHALAGHPASGAP